MAQFEIPGLLISIIWFLVFGVVWAKRYTPKFAESIFFYGVGLRIIGVLAYSTVVFTIYNATADPVIYFRWGVRFAEYFKSLDFSPIFDSTYWRGAGDARFVGTNFVGYPAALAVVLVGQSFRGTWLIFSLLSFAGLLLFARAFGRAYGRVEYENYLKMLLFFPALWFWTASISKDTWVFFGVGLFLSGMITKKRQQNFLLMGFGLLWVFLVRPQVAAMLAFSVAGAYGLLSLRKFNFQNVMVLILGAVGAAYALSVLGIGAGVTDAAEFATSQRTYSSYGGSEIQLASGPLGFIQAPINILLRPFPWEVSGFLQVITFAELYFIWFLVIKNWKSFMRALKSIRRDRLVAFSVVFILLFSLGAGLALSNLGLIARQRIILYPFMFILIYAYSDKRLNFLRTKRQAKIKAAKNG